MQQEITTADRKISDFISLVDALQGKVLQARIRRDKFIYSLERICDLCFEHGFLPCPIESESEILHPFRFPPLKKCCICESPIPFTLPVSREHLAPSPPSLSTLAVYLDSKRVRSTPEKPKPIASTKNVGKSWTSGSRYRRTHPRPIPRQRPRPRKPSRSAPVYRPEPETSDFDDLDLHMLSGKEVLIGDLHREIELASDDRDECQASLDKWRLYHESLVEERDNLEIFISNLKKQEAEVLQSKLKRMGVAEGAIASAPSNCVVCYDRIAVYVVAQCGHVCLCESCSKKVSSCPTCRKGKTMMMRVFPS